MREVWGVLRDCEVRGEKFVKKEFVGSLGWPAADRCARVDGLDRCGHGRTPTVRRRQAQQRRLVHEVFGGATKRGGRQVEDGHLFGAVAEQMQLSY